MADKTVKNINVGPVNAYINSTNIGFVENADVKIEIDGNITTIEAMATGKGPIAAMTSGSKIKVTLPILEDHKAKLAILFPYLESSSTDMNDGQAGQLRIKSKSGMKLNTFILSLFWKAFIDGTNQAFPEDATNPMSLQIQKAYVSSNLTLTANSGEAKSRELVIEGLADTDNDSLVATIGANTLPTPVLYKIDVTNGGSGYTSAPTVAFTGGAGTGATAKAYISNSKVYAVAITNAGSGYTSAPTISFTGGGGTGAAATATLL